VSKKRTGLILENEWHCGEERLLWGSKYFTEHPTIPLNQIIANLNLDMIGRTRKDGDLNAANKMLVKRGEIYVIGSKKMSTELGEVSEAVNQSYLRLNFNYQFDDPKDTSELFFRSDHFSYAQKGIPIIFYYAGEHEDYHQPPDSVEKIDYQNMEKVSRAVSATAWQLATERIVLAWISHYRLQPKEIRLIQYFQANLARKESQVCGAFVNLMHSPAVCLEFTDDTCNNTSRR
jgi:Zn-dependent M28 family amino/carboxypeptidase